MPAALQLDTIREIKLKEKEQRSAVDFIISSQKKEIAYTASSDSSNAGGCHGDACLSVNKILEPSAPPPSGLEQPSLPDIVVRAAPALAKECGEKCCYDCLTPGDKDGGT